MKTYLGLKGKSSSRAITNPLTTMSDGDNSDGSDTSNDSSGTPTFEGEMITNAAEDADNDSSDKS